MNSSAQQSVLESLEAIESRLIELERVSESGMDPLISVPLLFRDFHNLKSTLSMEGLDKSADLIHKSESCLDALRTGKGDPESDWADLLLAVVDQVRKVAGSDVDSASAVLSERLDSLLGSWLDQTQVQAKRIGFPLEECEAQALQAALSSRLTPYMLEKVVGDEIDAASVNSLPVFDAVAEAGALIAHRLLRAKGSGTILNILFATDKTLDDLSFILFDPLFPVSGFQTASSNPADTGKTKAAASKKFSPHDAAQCADEPIKLKRILIVDDEPVALMLLQRFLSPYGRLDTASDGLEAIEKVAKAISNHDQYHVVFLDIMIPGAPGSVVLEEIRKLEKQAGIPAGDGSRIVMASSISDYTSISTSFKNQGDVYLVKPIDFQIVDKTMQKLGFAKMTFHQTAVPSSKKSTG